MAYSDSAAIQHRFDALLDHLPAGVVMYDADGRVVSANRQALALLGRPEDQLIGIVSGTAAWGLIRTDNTVMPPSEYPANAVLRTGLPLADLIVGVPAALPGNVRWLISNAYPEFGADGKIRGVVVCFTDCTALKQAKRRLEKSEERLRLVLQGSTDAPWDLDLVSGEAYYSERWWTMLGYRPGELGGDATTWSRLIHPDDAPEATAVLREMLAGPGDSYSIEYRMRHRDGHDVPVLARGFISRDETGKAVRVSGTNTDLTERKRAEQRIYELAYFDHLTGLPNRRFLVEELDKALARSVRSGQLGALLFLDLDNFKLLNDTMGHDVGDVLLQQVAQRLRRTLRHSDQLARLGGDEFVVVFEELGPTLNEAIAEANHVVAKVLAMLEPPYHLADRWFSSSASIGVALFDGNATDIDTLLRQADLAMYRAKADGRHLARFFDPGMQTEADRQAGLESALRDGIQLHQFVLFCQPQFSVKGGLVGAEVLLRWRRQDGSLAAPSEFIGLAESSGLIVPLGQYVLEESCRALARWTGDSTLARLRLAVNVSAHQLRDADFPSDVAGILDDTGAPPGKLCLELTESVFAEDAQEVAYMMRRLSDQGLCLSLDAFGTGRSSLASLKRFPLTAVKIDRSFVHDVHLDPDAGPIVEAIIALARKLKLEIVAEGVEYEAQRSFLAKGGCSSLQGYLLGPPVPIEDFERLYSAAGVGHA